jgi:acylaminoacyl-peptidase
MKHTTYFLALTLIFLAPLALAEPIDKALISKITLQDENAAHALNAHPFQSTAEHNIVRKISQALDEGQPIRVFNEEKVWNALGGQAGGTHMLRFSISAHQFVTGKLNVEGAANVSLFLNGQAISGDGEFSLKLLNQDHRALLIVSGVEDWESFTIAWETPEQEQQNNQKVAVTFGDDSKRMRPTMRHFYDSKNVGMLDLSPNGELLMWSKSWYSDLGGDTPHSLVEIIDVDSQNVVYRFQGTTPRNVTWRDDSKVLAFVHDNTIFELDTSSWGLKELATDIKDVRSLEYLSDGELLLSWHKPEDKPHAFTKRLRALEDRWNYFRGNQQLYILDIQSGLFKQVTDNALSTRVFDINAEQRTAIIGRNPIDYDQPPHSLTQLLEIDLDTSDERLLGEYRTLNTAQYHKDGIIVIAGPSFSDGLGENIGQESIANDYDGQLYLLDNNNNTKPLSLNFDPSISGAQVFANGNLLLNVTEQDRQQLYEYDVDDERFSKVEINVEAMTAFSISEGRRPQLVYAGSNATVPQRVYTKRLRASNDTRLFDSVSEDFSNIELVTLKDWDYTTESGQFIDGRVYYPADFDETKKYPAIIYYYAGTVPVGRGFTGRYPFSWYASMGYVVYVLQPSGTIGYGQEFSARHVNAWGINTAEEIIESTKAFVDAHAFVDESRLGNMGASYGGFMTMYLSTKTDMFAASISHAGISNLTSYWGHGWWGYGYSGIATKGSWPWNRTSLYVEQSPVFAADKVTTPLLLVHGDADTNVPVGESHQMYTALMLLGKNVELIEFQGDDHHVNSRERRFRWWQTKLAYFDMKLKDEPQWWQHLYPSDKK